MTAFIWLHLPYIFFPSADWWVLTERMPLSRIPSLKQSRFQLLFFLFLSTESCFCCLPSLRVRDRHTSCIVCVCGVVCTGVQACTYMCVCMCVFVPMYVCMYICVHTSVKQKLLSCQCQVWRMVPLVKDSFSHCTGLPTLFRRAKCLYLMLDLCYLSMKLQLRTSYTFGTSWVISSIPPCGHEHKWNGLVLCHPILSLTCYQPPP